jgi:TRAP-type C4-dicarboxylate transport system substrate-binding protein
MTLKGALCAVVAGLAVVGTAQAQNWRMASGFSDAVFHTQNIHQFITDVEKQSGGQLKIRLGSNSSLYKQPEIKRAVETGQIQAGEILLSAYGNEMPLLSADVVPYLISGYGEAWKLYQATKPHLVELFAKSGLVMAYSVAWPGAGFFSTRPIDKVGDLKDNKMRSAAPLTGKWTDRLGMVSTVVQVPELAQAFSTGMVNMMFTSSPMAPQTQAWEFTKYYYDLNAIHGRNAVLINKAAFNKLAPNVQKAVLAAAATAEKRGWEMSKSADAGYKKQMQEKGMWVGPIKPEIEKLMQREARVVAKEWAGTLSPNVRASLEPFLNR